MSVKAGVEVRVQVRVEVRVEVRVRVEAWVALVSQYLNASRECLAHLSPTQCSVSVMSPLLIRVMGFGVRA